MLGEAVLLGHGGTQEMQGVSRTGPQPLLLLYASV